MALKYRKEATSLNFLYENSIDFVALIAFYRKGALLRVVTREKNDASEALKTKQDS